MTPRIYVASLSAYNSGKLHGRWVDASLGLDHIQDEVKSILESCPENHVSGPSEEWAIHDFEGFGKYQVKEYSDFETLADIAKAIEEHGQLIPALMDHLGLKDVQEAIDYQEENYVGQFEDWEDMAEELLEQTGELNEIPERLRYYFDYSAYGRDLRLGGDMFEIELDGETHFYWSR